MGDEKYQMLNTMIEKIDDGGQSKREGKERRNFK